MKSCGVIMMKPKVYLVSVRVRVRVRLGLGLALALEWPKVYTQPTTEPSSHEYHDLCVSCESE